MRTLVGYLKGLVYALRRRRNTRRPNITSLNNRLLYEHIKNLNGRNLAQMMATSKKYRNFIQADPRLMARINQAKRNVTRQRINRMVNQITTQMGNNWTPSPRSVERIVQRAMIRNNHPLNNEQIWDIFMNVLH
jgi:hypothetical protein